MDQTAEALVVDASVAAKWHLRDESDVGHADLLLMRFVTGELTLVAPEQIRSEVPATISVATIVKTPRLSKADGQVAIEQFLALGIQTFRSDELVMTAYALVHQHAIAFYDGLYLALAQQLHIPFITADNKLYQRIKSRSDVIWLGDYAEPQTE